MLLNLKDSMLMFTLMVTSNSSSFKVSDEFSSATGGFNMESLGNELFSSNILPVVVWLVLVLLLAYLGVQHYHDR